MASSTSANTSTERLCSICLEIVSYDNNRGKAELICGHLFHLDCIGTEFNYRSKMRCPTCRVTESAEWIIPDHESDNDEESPSDEVNSDLNIHIFVHDGRGRTSTSRGQIVVTPTIHYHQHTTVLQQAGGNRVEVSRSAPYMYAVQRAPGDQLPHNSPNVEVRYDPGTIEDTWPRDINEPTNMTWNESTAHISDVRDPTTELSLSNGLRENHQQDEV